MALPVDMKKKILQAIFPSLATAEVNFLIRNLPRVSDFMDDATLEDKINHACSSTGIPFCDILCPPVENCTNCGRRLTLHNQPVHITIFKIAGRVQGIKITSKCQPCGLIYKYAQHGNENVGYQFYQERRSLVEASNVAYFERQLCLYQVFLRKRETENLRASDGEIIEMKLENMSGNEKLPATTAEAQGTKDFLAENAALLTMPMDTSQIQGQIDVCNKDTGGKKTTLQKCSESPSQVFYLTLHYLYLRLKDLPEDQWEHFILSYDNMCNVDRLIAARSPVPLPEPFDKMWLKITKVIDRLHLRNHKNPECAKRYSAEPLKEIHPKLNTMVAEQTFTWASRYKKILCAMPQRRFLFYYH
ncbi:Hypothetical predicted protein [Paramuricea clavata]|uniref:Uncharacterized protein n=1 Tax=Paramuricea clavata TaxID=317549 RepID=A0A6S7FFY2_PARCT|nr:Hypothetical predicted protein [Paramuricea clavata]